MLVIAGLGLIAFFGWRNLTSHHGSSQRTQTHPCARTERGQKQQRKAAQAHKQWPTAP